MTKKICKNKPACMFKGIVLIILILDVITKMLIERYKPSGSGFFSINYATNTGAAFGILKGGNIFLIILSFIVLAAIVYILFFRIKRLNPGIAIFSALLFAGTTGNLLDRLFRGYVIDFLNFSFWPAFNVADMAITAGVIGLIYFVYKE